MSIEIVKTAHIGHDKARREGSKKPANPLQAGILSYCARSDIQNKTVGRFEASDLPKRFTLYSPLLLLPGNFANHSPKWADSYSCLKDQTRDCLFESIASAFIKSGKPVTHIAINAPILPSKFEGALGAENTLRSPFNLLPLYGNFGPSFVEERTNTPSQADFDATFWVSTSQLAGIEQVWAPRWTMFSRGNLSEKARILKQGGQRFPGMSEEELETPMELAEVIDMYVGIGYFAFSYLRSGVKRVWGWDLNPWSIEGLRRGCKKNGWRCIVVQVAEDGSVAGSSPSQLAEMIADSDNATSKSQPVRCIAFLGNNKWAASIVRAIRAATGAFGRPLHSSIRHVNLGLLPSSRPSWENAVKLLDVTLGGWLHVHMNVDAHSIDSKAEVIAEEINSLAEQHSGEKWKATCQHIEQVKTYAPGVMHCVFDIKVST